MPVILFEHGRLRGKSLNLPPQGTVRIGRDRQCQVRLTDNLISRIHCILQGKKNTWVLEDCQSSNQTFVNGNAIAQKKLVPGDLVQIGNTVFSFFGSTVDSLIGTTIKGYLLEKRIGRGGMGTVYLARQLSLQRKIALKILDKNQSQKKDFVERFLREARSAAQLNHPNVVQVYDTGNDGANYYIAMEFLAGGSLENKIVQNGKLNFQQAVPFVIEALKALSFAEKQEIVHRDIKPGNLLFTIEEHIKLADLGIALDLKDPKQILSGTAAGSPAYMAPEQIRNLVVDNRADIYGMGATLYHAISGEPPFESPTVKEMLSKKLRIDPVPLKEMVPEVPAKLSNTVDMMLARDPGERFSCAEEAGEALQSALHAHRHARRNPHPRRHHHHHTSIKTSSSKSSSPGAAIAIVVALAIIVALVFIISKTNKNHENQTNGKKQPLKTASIQKGHKTNSNLNNFNAPRNPLLNRQRTNTTSEKARKKEEKQKKAAAAISVEIKRLIETDKFIEASGKIESFSDNEFALNYIPQLETSLKDKISKLVQSERNNFDSLCKKADFEAAKTLIDKLLKQLPQTEQYQVDPLLNLLEESENKFQENLDKLAGLKRQAYEKISHLDFAGIEKDFQESLSTTNTALSEKAAKILHDLQCIQKTWLTLKTTFEKAAKKKKPLSFSLTHNPLDQADSKEKKYFIADLTGNLFSFWTTVSKKEKKTRRVLSIKPGNLLSLLSIPEGLTKEEVKNALGLLLLLRCGRKASLPLLLSDDLPVETRNQNKVIASGLGNAWFPSRVKEATEELTQLKKDEQSGKSSPEGWDYLAYEAAALLSDRSAEQANSLEENTQLLKKMFVTARINCLLTGDVKQFFHAKATKLSSRNLLELTYDFSTGEQIQDFKPKGKDLTNIHWIKEQKALELQGEARLLGGNPFKDFISITGMVIRTSPNSPNVNVALWTFQDDKVTPSLNDFNWTKFRNTKIGNIGAEYVVCGMGFFIDLKSGGIRAQGLGRLVNRFRSFLPAYLRSPAFVIFGGKHGKTVGGTSGELIWEIPTGGKARAPLTFAIAIKNGDVKWNFKKRTISFKEKKADMHRLKETLSSEGSVTLFTNGSIVRFSMLKISGLFQKEWARGEAKRIAEKELKTIVPGDGQDKESSTTGKAPAGL